MKKFKVTASFSTVCHVFIDAEDMDEALEIARDMDGGQFEPGAMDDWFIENAEEVTQ